MSKLTQILLLSLVCFSPLRGQEIDPLTAFDMVTTDAKEGVLEAADIIAQRGGREALRLIQSARRYIRVAGVLAAQICAGSLPWEDLAVMFDPRDLIDMILDRDISWGPTMHPSVREPLVGGLRATAGEIDFTVDWVKRDCVEGG